MAILRLCITKNEKKWNEIEAAINKKNSTKVVMQKGSGINGYISSEIRKRYSGRSIADCAGINVTHQRKDFTIEVPDDVMKKIECEAKQESISLAALISKFILDPLIYSTTESQ